MKPKKRRFGRTGSLGIRWIVGGGWWEVGGVQVEDGLIHLELKAATASPTALVGQ